MSEYQNYSDQYLNTSEPAVLHQTPKSSLKHPRYIVGMFSLCVVSDCPPLSRTSWMHISLHPFPLYPLLHLTPYPSSFPILTIGTILSLIFTFFINYGIGRLTLLSQHRIPLWIGQKDIHDPFTDAVIKYAGIPIWVDLIISGFFCALLGTVIGVCGIRGDVKKGKAIPILDRDLQPYRAFGVVTRNTWLRGVIFAAFGLLIVFPVFCIIFKIACDNGSFSMYEPTPGADLQCYMSVPRYSWLKGGFCLFIALVISPFVEFSGLNRKYLTDEQYEGFLNELRKKGLIQDDMVPPSESA